MKTALPGISLSSQEQKGYELASSQTSLEIVSECSSVRLGATVRRAVDAIDDVHDLTTVSGKGDPKARASAVQRTSKVVASVSISTAQPQAPGELDQRRLHKLSEQTLASAKDLLQAASRPIETELPRDRFLNALGSVHETMGRALDTLGAYPRVGVRCGEIIPTVVAGMHVLKLVECGMQAYQAGLCGAAINPILGAVTAFGGLLLSIFGKRKEKSGAAFGELLTQVYHALSTQLFEMEKRLSKQMFDYYRELSYQGAIQHREAMEKFAGAHAETRRLRYALEALRQEEARHATQAKEQVDVLQQNGLRAAQAIEDSLRALRSEKVALLVAQVERIVAEGGGGIDIASVEQMTAELVLLGVDAAAFAHVTGNAERHDAPSIVSKLDVGDREKRLPYAHPAYQNINLLRWHAEQTTSVDSRNLVNPVQWADCARAFVLLMQTAKRSPSYRPTEKHRAVIDQRLNELFAAGKRVDDFARAVDSEGRHIPKLVADLQASIEAAHAQLGVLQGQFIAEVTRLARAQVFAEQRRHVREMPCPSFELCGTAHIPALGRGATVGWSGPEARKAAEAKLDICLVKRNDMVYRFLNSESGKSTNMPVVSVKILVAARKAAFEQYRAELLSRLDEHEAALAEAPKEDLWASTAPHSAGFACILMFPTGESRADFTNPLPIPASYPFPLCTEIYSRLEAQGQGHVRMEYWIERHRALSFGWLHIRAVFVHADCDDRKEVFSHVSVYYTYQGREKNEEMWDWIVTGFERRFYLMKEGSSMFTNYDDFNDASEKSLLAAEAWIVRQRRAFALEVEKELLGALNEPFEQVEANWYLLQAFLTFLYGGRCDDIEPLKTLTSGIVPLTKSKLRSMCKEPDHDARFWRTLLLVRRVARRLPDALSSIECTVELPLLTQTMEMLAACIEDILAMPIHAEPLREATRENKLRAKVRKQKERNKRLEAEMNEMNKKLDMLLAYMHKQSSRE